MKSIEERARKFAISLCSYRPQNGEAWDIDTERGYIKGATDQQKIDIEKACYAHCKCCAFFNKNCKGQDKYCSDYKGFKKAMEE